MKRAAVLLAGFLVFQVGAQPTLPMDAYGLTFGKPLDLPACAPSKATGYQRLTSGPCLGLFTDDPQRDSGAIFYPYAQGPLHVSGGEIGFRRDSANNLSLLVISTYGAAAQEPIFSMLMGKYGKPTESSTRKVTNAFGATYDAIAATWESPELHVRFIGMTSVKSGELVIGTPAAMRARDEDIERALNKGRPRL